MRMDESQNEVEASHEAQNRSTADPREHRNSRRQLLRQMAGVSLALPLWSAHSVLSQVPAPRHRGPTPPPEPSALSPDDDQFLDDLERSHFLFFWEQANPQ